MSDGSTTAARSKDLINSAFATGWDHGRDLRSAAACAVRAVQENTGLTIDHVVVVDFAGLQTMVDAIGGVDICIPQDMHDDHTGLTLAAGRRVLDGETAVKFARDRYDDAGDRSDIFRIGNQQRLVAAMAGQVLSRDVLTDVTTLVPFLTAATASLTTDLSLPAMTGLAYAARGIRADRITFLTIPWADAPGQWGRVVWTKDADAVWQNLAADRPIVGAEPTAEGEGTTNGGAPDAGAAGAGVPGTGPAGASTRSPVTTSAPGSSSAAPDTPTPAQTKRPGREPFTPADVTAICS
jgi:LCP family protein required for cell wall assembly